MSCKSVRGDQDYIGCLTREDVLKAWGLESSGKCSRVKAAMMFHCDPATLARAYNRLGLSPPQRGHYKPRRKK